MQFQGKQNFSEKNGIRSHKITQITNKITSPVPEKRKIITDDYSLLTIQLLQPYKIEFRVYDDGVSYRFSTAFKDSIIVQSELAEFNFSQGSSAYFPGINKRDDADIYHTSFEELYPLRKLDSIGEMRWPIHRCWLYPMINIQKSD